MRYQNRHLDEAAFWANSVRRLAKDTYRVTRGENVDTAEVEALLARIKRLSIELSALPRSSIHRWLDNLRNEVEASAMCLEHAMIA